MPRARKRSPQTIMIKQEVKLLIKSDICDKNTKLKDILCYYDRRIAEKDLIKIKIMDIETYRLLNTKDAVKEIVDNTSSEWIQKKYEGKIKEPCKLCGNKKSEDKYTIVNKINGNELMVGSSCIDKFKYMDNRLHGIPIRKFSQLTKQNPEKLKKIIEFNESYGSSTDIFAEWTRRHNEFDIIFPKEYEQDFQNILKKARNFYNGYIDSKLDKDIEFFKVYIKEFEYRYNKCIEFYESKKDSKYVLNKQLASFLKDEGMTATLSYIQDKDEITRDVAKNIHHINFINRFKPEIEDAFKKYDVKLVNTEEKNIKFTFKNKNYQPIELYSTLKNFTFKFSDIFYNIIDFSKNDIVGTLKISNSYTNVENFVSMLGYGLKRTGHNLKLDSELYEKQQIEVHRRGLKTFATLNLPQFLDEYKECLYLTEAAAKNVLLAKIATINNWTDKSDKKKYDVGNIAEKWAK